MSRLFVRLDFPLKDAVIKVDDKATLADLKAAVAKAFSVEETSAKRYWFQAGTYGKDCVELGLSSKGDEELLSDSGVKEGWTILGRAPNDLKPIKKRKDMVEEDTKKDTPTVSADRYKGFSVKNALKKYVNSQGKSKLAVEYLEIYAKEILKQKEFTKVPKSLLINILKSDTLSAKEGEIFEAVITWGKAACKAEKLDGDKADDLKKVLTDVLPHVRFPAMTTTDIAVKVSASGLLESDQILDLFTYVGMKSSSSDPSKLSLGKSIRMFKPTERKGRKPPAWFKWDNNKKFSSGGLYVSDDGLTVTSNTTSYYMPIVGDIELSEGVWEYEIKLEQFYVTSYSVCIGWVPNSWSSWSSSAILGYSGYMSVGWAYGCGSAVKYDGTTSGTSYGRTCSQGDVVRTRIDFEKKTIEYWVNDNSQGVAHTNVNGTVRPAMSLYGSNTTKLQFPK